MTISMRSLAALAAAAAIGFVAGRLGTAFMERFLVEKKRDSGGLAEAV